MSFWTIFLENQQKSDPLPLQKPARGVWAVFMDGHPSADSKGLREGGQEWKAKCPISKAIVAGFRGKVA